MKVSPPRAILALLCFAALACGLPSLPVTPSPAQCPEATPEPLWVSPLPASTDQDSILVEVIIGNGEEVTVTTESGTFTAQGDFNTATPAQVEVTLLPGVTHHLEVSARVKQVTGFGGCPYGGYTLHTTRDRDGGELVIQQTGGEAAGGSTPTFCPQATQAPLTVQSVPASTDQSSVVVSVSHPLPGQVTIVTESGTFTGTTSPGGTADIEVKLLPDTVHHLQVTIEVPLTGPPNCSSGGYTLSTEVDAQGQSLVIAQGAGAAAGGVTPTFCPPPTPEPLWVEPIPPTTDQYSVAVTVYIGNGDAVDVVTESGKFGAYGIFTATIPALVQVTLDPGVTHHLEVIARVRQMAGFGGCTYGGYTLSTTRDRDGGELVIQQTSAP